MNNASWVEILDKTPIQKLSCMHITKKTSVRTAREIWTVNCNKLREVTFMQQNFKNML